MFRLGLLILLVSLLGCESLDNGLGKTPQMGYNAWNRFQCNVNETIIKRMADAVVASGLKDAGYIYINLDDCWQSSRDANGNIVADPKFPSGIKALADYVHSKGLLFGVYSDAGNTTCKHRPGSLGFEVQDANSYASWGVDYLKYDNCKNEGIDPRLRYPPMRDALNATGRPILYSMCEWGYTHPATWSRPVGNSWRTTADIRDWWEKMINRTDTNEPLAVFAGPGGWNDADMLEVGNGGMTNTEYITHFSLWCLMKSPLLVGCDPSNMSDETAKILLNTEAIAINQDPLGVQARRVASSTPINYTYVDSNMLVQPCSEEKRKLQTFVVTDDDYIQTTDSENARCLAVDNCFTSDLGNHVSASMCVSQNSCGAKNEIWSRNNDTIVSVLAGMCLENDNDGFNIQVKECSGEAKQKWTFGDDSTIRSSLGGCLTVLNTIPPGDREVWAGPLFDGSFAVGLFNRGLTEVSVTAHWKDIGIPENMPALVRDLWEHADKGVFTGRYTASIPSHGFVLLKVTAV